VAVSSGKRTTLSNGLRLLVNDGGGEDGPVSADVTPGSVAPTSPGADASDALRQLNRLREQGLISEAEHSTKRGEILARL